jgi:hypothetical protein
MSFGLRCKDHRRSDAEVQLALLAGREIASRPAFFCAANLSFDFLA